MPLVDPSLSKENAARPHRTPTPPARHLQRSLIVTAFVAALAGQAHGADVRAVMSITANVVDTVRIGASYQAQDLVITSRDIARGYVDVAAASRIEIGNRGPAVLEFRGTSTVFRSVTVTGGGESAEFGVSGGTLLQRPLHADAGSVALSYRFDLSPGVTPGPHRWPLALTVLPM